MKGVKLTIEERTRLMVQCTCRDCRHVTSFLDANLELTIRARQGARWAEDHPLEAASRRIR